MIAEEYRKMLDTDFADAGLGMKAAMHLRVGNKEQLDVETEMKKKEQEFKEFCERKYGMVGVDIPR